MPLTSDSYFGIRTLRQGTAISHSQYGNFTDLGLPELLVARGSRVDVYKVKPTGELLEVVSLPLNGRVAYMQLLKRPGLTDTLFVCTSKCSIAHLSWDAAAGSVVSHATGRLCEFCGKRYGRGDIVGDLSPDGRLLCLGLYRCELHFVVISPEGELSDAFSVALPSNPQLYMRDYRRVQFLHQATVPTLVVLSRDCRAASLYTVDVAEKSIGYSGPLALWPEGKSAVFIQATPLGGVFAGFDGGLTMHINPWRSEALSATTRHTISRCARVTDTVYVGCDRTGGVYILSLSPLAGARVGEFVAQRIGDSYVASTLCVVGSKLVFVGSMFWDGKLARITPSPRVAPDDKLWLEKALAEVHSACLLQTTGPITDFCPLPHSGEIAACIGGHSVAAAAILRTQFTLNDVCVYRISDVHSLWVLPDGSGDGISDRYIVMSFGCGTFVLRLDDGGTKLSPYHIKGISRKTQTLYCALLPSGKFLRVTQQKVIIVDTAANTKKDSFLVTHSTMEVNCVSFTRDGTVGVYSVGSCALNVTHVVFGTDTYKTVLKVPFPADVAALDACSTPGLCAVALWDGRVGVFSLPDIGAIATKMVPGLRGAIRSVVLGKFAGCGAALYLICGTSEGLVVVYVLSDNDLKELWRMDLGMEQVTINAAYVAPGSDVISHVFASSLTTVRIAATEEEDADKVEYGYCGGGLCATYVKADEITSLCQFRGTVDGRDNIVVGIGNNEVKIFSISKKPSVGVSRRYRQKLYIPNKIVYQKETDVVATANVGLARSSSCFIVYDKLLAEPLDKIEFRSDEVPYSLVSGKFAGDDTPYFIVGTRTQGMYLLQPKGRITVLKFRPEIQKVVCVFDIEVGGTPTALDFFNGKLVAAYDFKLHLFTWEGAALVEDVITYTTGLTTVSLFALNSKDILVADYMEPLELVSLSHGSLVQRCRDIFHSSFTAVIPITETIYLATDCFYNVFCVEKRVPKKVKKGGSNGGGDGSNNNNDEEDDDDEEDEDENAKKEKYMTNVAEFHVGEYVTCLKKMSISGRHSNSNAVTYTTTNGSVGEVWMLSRDDFMFWATVEGAIANLSISQIGGLTHAEWRAYSTERRVTPVARFVDFDTIRLFKDLDREDACAVCRALRSFGTVSVEELSRRIDGVLGK